MSRPARAVLLISTLFAGGCASTSYLAKINDEKITGTELKEEFTRRHGGHQKFLVAGEKEVNDFLNIVIDWRLLVQESYRLDLENLPEVRRAVAEYSDRKAADYLVKVEIDEKARPTPEQIREVWELETTRLYKARQIVVDTRAEAEGVHMQLLFGGDFETLARRCSIDASRIYGGRLPFVGWGAMDPAWERVVFSMGPGETSAVFATPEGWEIVELLSVEVVEKPYFAKASPRIEAILKKRTLEERKREFSEFLWTKYQARQTDVDLGPEGLHEAITKTPDAPLATWDGGRLTVKEFAQGLEWSRFAGLLPGRFRAEIELQRRQTVNGPLTVLEARARGYEKVPEVAEAVRRYQDDMMEGALYSDYILKGVTVTDEEARRYYEEHPSEFAAPEKRRVSHIVVPTREEAEAIRKEIAEGQRFEQLVARSTDVESAKRGGDLGWITKKDAKGEFEAVFSLAEAEVSAPIQSKYGFHLLHVTEIVPEQPLSFEEAKERVRAKLLEQKQREKRKLWVQRLREASRIEFNNAGIRAFVKANSAS